MDYLAEVEAETPAAAVELAYSGRGNVQWRAHGTEQLDAVHMVALDSSGREIESTARGDFV